MFDKRIGRQAAGAFQSTRKAGSRSSPPPLPDNYNRSRELQRIVVTVELGRPTAHPPEGGDA